MKDNMHVNAEVLDKLRQQLINRIESTDDATLLSRCLAVMDTAQVLSQEEQEEDWSHDDDDLENETDGFLASYYGPGWENIKKICISLNYQ